MLLLYKYLLYIYVCQYIKNNISIFFYVLSFSLFLFMCCPFLFLFGFFVTFNFHLLLKTSITSIFAFLLNPVHMFCVSIEQLINFVELGCFHFIFLSTWISCPSHGTCIQNFPLNFFRQRSTASNDHISTFFGLFIHNKKHFGSLFRRSFHTFYSYKTNWRSPNT